MSAPLWIFGYGSLVFRPAFPFLARHIAWLDGYERRFWQASTDHRGTPAAPGRVVTLVRRRDARCGGVAYLVAAADRERVLSYLDVREIGGYERLDISLRLGAGVEERGGLLRRVDDGASDGDHGMTVSALVYFAGPANPQYVGSGESADIIAIARTRIGPSGTNRDYVLQLAQALRSLQIDDPHVAEIAAGVVDGDVAADG